MEIAQHYNSNNSFNNGRNSNGQQESRMFNNNGSQINGRGNSNFVYTNPERPNVANQNNSTGSIAGRQSMSNLHSGKTSVMNNDLSRIQRNSYSGKPTPNTFMQGKQSMLSGFGFGGGKMSLNKGIYSFLYNSKRYNSDV